MKDQRTHAHSRSQIKRFMLLLVNYRFPLFSRTAFLCYVGCPTEILRWHRVRFTADRKLFINLFSHFARMSIFHNWQFHTSRHRHHSVRCRILVHFGQLLYHPHSDVRHIGYNRNSQHGIPVHVLASLTQKNWVQHHNEHIDALKIA